MFKSSDSQSLGFPAPRNFPNVFHLIIIKRYTAITCITMSLSASSTRPLACLKQALRQCRAERQHHRQYAVPATTESAYPSLQTRYPLPTPGFRTSQTTKQNRMFMTLFSTLYPSNGSDIRPRKPHPKTKPRRPPPPLHPQTLPRPHRRHNHLLRPVCNLGWDCLRRRCRHRP